MPTLAKLLGPFMALMLLLLGSALTSCGSHSESRRAPDLPPLPSSKPPAPPKPPVKGKPADSGSKPSQGEKKAPDAPGKPKAPDVPKKPKAPDAPDQPKAPKPPSKPAPTWKELNGILENPKAPPAEDRKEEPQKKRKAPSPFKGDDFQSQWNRMRAKKGGAPKKKKAPLYVTRVLAFFKKKTVADLEAYKGNQALYTDIVTHLSFGLDKPVAIDFFKEMKDSLMNGVQQNFLEKKVGLALKGLVSSFPFSSLELHGEVKKKLEELKGTERPFTVPPGFESTDSDEESSESWSSEDSNPHYL